MERLGMRLLEEHKRLRLTQSRLGELGGVEANAQGHYENGQRIPRADYLHKIALAGVDICYVVSGLRQLSFASLQSTSPPKQSEVSLEDATEAFTLVLERLRSTMLSTANALYELATFHQIAGHSEDGEMIQQLGRSHADVYDLLTSVSAQIESIERSS